jgi:hypothetical protein
MLQSILDSTKKVLSIDPSYTVFDEDIIMHINSVFGTLRQLGVGPGGGFQIVDNTSTWESVIGTDNRYNEVKTYVYLRVRLLFDPPGTSFHIEAIKEQIKELEWRLQAERESTSWVDPTLGLDYVSTIDGNEYNATVIDGNQP